MPRPDYLKRQIDNLLNVATEHGADKIGAGSHHHGRSFRPDELRTLRDMLETPDGVAFTSSPWPEPDNPPTDETFWRNYSAERVQSRVEAIYRAALKGYREIVDHWFPELTTTMSTAALMPLQLVGELHAKDAEAALEYRFLPLAGGHNNEVRVHVASPANQSSLVGWSGETDSPITQLRSESASWIRLGRAWSRLSIEGRMPATRIAVGWLWRDLSSLHLITGPAPAD